MTEEIKPIPIPKKEIMDFANNFLQRIYENPKVKANAKRYLKLNFAFLQSRFVPEEDIQYSLAFMSQFFKELETLVRAREDPALQKLGLEKFQEKTIKELITITPEQKQERKFNWSKLAEYGALRDA